MEDRSLGEDWVWVCGGDFSLIGQVLCRSNIWNKDTIQRYWYYMTIWMIYREESFEWKLLARVKI